MSKVELTRKWWALNRPKEIKGTELEKALAAVEQAKGPALAAALEAVPDAVTKVCKSLDKKTQKDLLKNLEILRRMAEDASQKALGEVKAQATAQAKAESKTKAEPGPDSTPDKADEETPADKLFDPATLRQTIRLALRRALIFAFALAAKPEQCALGVSPRGNPRQLARLAKERSGATKLCWGQVQADENDLTILTISLESPPVAGLARIMRNYFQAAHITTFKKFRVLLEGKELESDGGGEAPPPGEKPETTRDAPVAAPPAADPALATPVAPPTPEQLEVLEDRRRDFKKARAAWIAVKTKAEADLEKVKDGARMAYLADPEQFPKIDRGCKDIDAILENLDDELRDTLDSYASTPLKNQPKLKQLGEKAVQILDRYRVYVDSNPVLKAIDQKEFADVLIHAPIAKALADLRKALS
jgi:hypothetical protein